ncbi:calcium-binding protein [Inquilinus sp. CA228]|uniref:calcium-binding protein n=1 Tax=Inquilinus sp. CA228 TaxID=3455609 RepID=UPI003F8D4048
MAIVDGTAGKDFIHVVDDGLAVPAGFHEIALATGGNDIIQAGAGDDIVVSGDGGDLVDGGTGIDKILGGEGDDTLIGGDGDDSLTGGAGADVLTGGAGIDTVFYGESAEGVRVTIGRVNGGGAATGDFIAADVENVSGSAFDDSLFGSDAGNELFGLDGGDTLSGGAGEDVLRGGDGNDLLLGDNGQGSDDDDILIGGDGNDSLRGGFGADRLDGGAGIDAIGYSGAAAVTVNLTTQTVSGLEAQGDVISGIENAFGGSGNDTLIGSATANLLDAGFGNDSLSGLGGDDILKGSFGDDLLRGGAGADVLNGEAGIDLATYFGATAGVTVNLLTGTGSSGEAQGDSYVSIENVNGSKGGDVITGSAGVNVLNGFEGNDLLLGAAGRDVLSGGVGADVFAFTVLGDSVVGANADRIVDFSRVQGDRIHLAEMDANSTASGNQGFTFIGSALYHHVAGEMRFAVTSPGVTTIAGDVNGDGNSDFHIVLTGTVALTATDFVL